MTAGPLSVVFVLPSLVGGGAENVALTLAAALDRTRFAPHLVALRAAGPLAARVPPDMPVTDLDRAGVRRALPGLFRALRALRPAAIFSTMGYLNQAVLGVSLLATPRSRVIVREANTVQSTLDALRPAWAARAGYRRLYPRAAAILCPSRLLADDLARRFAIPAARLHIFPNPVDQDRIRAAAAPAIRQAGDGPRFVMVGRLTQPKGWERLLDMFAALPDRRAHLAILGDGPDRAAVTARIAAAGLDGRVTLEGFLQNPWRHIAGADALLLASHREGMPNAALEALALGTPVIATPEAGGVAELARDSRPGAVTVVAAGPDFISAATKAAAHDGTSLRSSLLPASYLLSSSAARFAALLSAA